MRVVLDADAVIGALDGSDPYYAEARRPFRVWQRQDTAWLISVLNLSEVLVAPAADRMRLRAAREAIAALGVTIHRPSEAIGVDAAPLRRAHPISLPDAYCLAAARYADDLGRLLRREGAPRRRARRDRADRDAPTATTPTLTLSRSLVHTRRENRSRGRTLALDAEPLGFG